MQKSICKFKKKYPYYYKNINTNPQKTNKSHHFTIQPLPREVTKQKKAGHPWIGVTSLYYFWEWPWSRALQLPEFALKD